MSQLNAVAVPHQSVAVFGGSGFIGQYVVQRLARAGARVRVPTRDAGRVTALKPFGDVGQVAALPCNIHDDATVARAIAGCDAVINLTGILYEPSARDTFDAIQHQAAARIAAAAAAAGITDVVHMSAIGANASSPSAYAKSKAAGEQAALTAVPTARILRPSVVFGPEDDFFNRFAQMAVYSPILPLIAGGKTRFQPVYVGDVADAVIATLVDPARAGLTFELGGPDVRSFKQLLEMMLQQIDRPRRLMNLSMGLARFQASIFEKLPGPPMLTRDQLLLLQSDNVVSGNTPTLAALGLAATPMAAILPLYLEIYRPGGRYSRIKAA